MTATEHSQRDEDALLSDHQTAYSIEFLNNTGLQTTASMLECKGFSQRLFHLPSDRYAYSSKFFPSPVTSPGRLPGPVKDLYKHVRFLKLNLLNSDLGLIVLTTRYGREGMATKKYDDSCLIFDAEFMEHLCSPSSIKNYEEALANFVLLINKLHTDFSSHTTLSDVRSHHFARIKTSDPSVKIDLSFEHYAKTELGIGYQQNSYKQHFRDGDIALVIAYVFHDKKDDDLFSDEPTIKKTKLQPFSPVKRGVLEYSKIKLPAAAFGQYLAHDCKQYLADCLSLHQKQTQARLERQQQQQRLQ